MKSNRVTQALTPDKEFTKPGVSWSTFPEAKPRVRTSYTRRKMNNTDQRVNLTHPLTIGLLDLIQGKTRTEKKRKAELTGDSPEAVRLDEV
ncbi:hypothetical protein BTVI_107709 [Pitangus sulphuratus]|nr:hypothetical protein BTVI_107709 [Pitangus sulphuratus]